MAEDLVRQFALKSRGEEAEAVLHCEAVLAAILEERNPARIEELLRTVDRDVTSDQVIWVLVHAVESFEDAPYCHALIRSGPHLAQSCPELGELLVLRVLNSDSAKLHLMEQAHGATVPEGVALRRLLTAIGKGKDAVAEKARDAVKTLTEVGAPGFT